MTAIELDSAAAQRSAARLAGYADVAVVNTDFERYASGGQQFVLTTFLASLHHMDLRTSLRKGRS